MHIFKDLTMYKRMLFAFHYPVAVVDYFLYCTMERSKLQDKFPCRSVQLHKADTPHEGKDRPIGCFRIKWSV